MTSRNSLFLTIGILFFINLILASYTTPVTDFGDASSYIEMSKKFLGENINENFAHRSPLFSLLLAIMIKVFGIPNAFSVFVYIQYGLVFITALIIYSLFKRILKVPLFPFLIAVLFNFSLSTIYFASIMLTEILTISLLFISLYFLLKYFDYNKIVYLFYTGLSLGLLCLARFNSVPIVFTFFLLLTYLIIIVKRDSFIKAIASIAMFTVPIFIIINVWCLYNFSENGFYGLFPGGGTIASRNVVVASIRPNNNVSSDNKPILDIFVKARNEYFKTEEIINKGSLVSNDKIGFVEDLYSGYQIYKYAYPELLIYFSLKESDGEHGINMHLKGFYKEIARENMGFIWRLRFYSLISSFRASTSGVLPENYGNINLNFLPSIVIKVNKLGTFFMSLFVFFSFFGFLFQASKGRCAKMDFVQLTIFVIIFSFWGINFLFATESNANRFKFPVEPLVLGMFIFYARELFLRLLNLYHSKLKSI